MRRLKRNYMQGLVDIAEAYCMEYGYYFLFVNDIDATFAYETKDGKIVHKSFFTMAEELGLEVE